MALKLSGSWFEELIGYNKRLPVHNLGAFLARQGFSTKTAWGRKSAMIHMEAEFTLCGTLSRSFFSYNEFFDFVVNLLNEYEKNPRMVWYALNESTLVPEFVWNQQLETGITVYLDQFATTSLAEFIAYFLNQFGSLAENITSAQICELLVVLGTYAHTTPK